MGKLIITDSNGRHEYLINTRLADHVIDDITSKILKDFPQDASGGFRTTILNIMTVQLETIKDYIEANVKVSLKKKTRD